MEPPYPVQETNDLFSYWHAHDGRFQNQDARIQHLEELAKKQQKAIELLTLRLANTEGILGVYFTTLAVSASQAGSSSAYPPGVPPQVAANIAASVAEAIAGSPLAPPPEEWTPFPSRGW
tara:strand:- start:92 stop:451 length:360 start_codon:yes stop_codon:yes gene_type:complete